MSSSTYKSTLMIWVRLDRHVVRVNPLPAKIDSAADSKVGRDLGFKFGLCVSALHWDAAGAIQRDSDAGIFRLCWMAEVFIWMEP